MLPPVAVTSWRPPGLLALPADLQTAGYSLRTATALVRAKTSPGPGTSGTARELVETARAPGGSPAAGVRLPAAHTALLSFTASEGEPQWSLQSGAGVVGQSGQEAGLDPLRGVPEQPNDGCEAHQHILHRQTVLVRSASQSQHPGVIVLHG